MKVNIKTVIAFVIGVLVMVLLVPLLLIWSLNTLFPVLAIPYTFETYLAALVLNAFLQSHVTTKRKV